MKQFTSYAKTLFLATIISFFAFANATADYCTAGTSVEDEYISNVTLGDIDKDSGWQGGVADYTDESTDIKLGEDYTITVENGNAWSADRVKVWIDWDQSETFDNNEDWELTSTDDGETFKGTLNISLNSDAVEGETRMRVVMRYSSEPQACGSDTWGEVEDYTVNIILPKPDAALDQIIIPSPVTLGTHTIQAQISSQSADMDLTSCVIHWSINGEEQTSVNWSGLLEEDKSTTVTLGDVDISYAPDGPFNPFIIQAWITDANGDPDAEENLSNNSRSIQMAPPLNDAGVISLISPSGTIEPGTYDIIVEITNYAPKPLESVTIEWSVDGLTQSPKTWNGFLRAGETAEFNVGSYDIFVKSPLVPFEFEANTSKPNGVSDQNTANDAFSSSFAVSLIAGDYSIGGTDGTFPTLKACFNYLSASGIVGDGPCTFTVANGTYYGPLELIDFSRGNNTFVFKSATGNPANVVVKGDGSDSKNYVAKIYGVENVEFHGMSFETEAGYEGYGVNKIFELEMADNFILNNAVLHGTSGIQDDMSASLVHAIDSDELQFTNLAFQNGSYGIYASGNSGLMIENVSFKDFATGAVTQSGGFEYGGGNYPDENHEGMTYINNCTFEARSGVGPMFGVKVNGGAVITNNSFKGIGNEANMTGVVIEVDGDSYMGNEISNNDIPLAKNVHGIVVKGNAASKVNDNDVTVTNYSYYETVYGVMADGLGGADFELMNNDIFVTDGVAFHSNGAALMVNKNSLKTKAIDNYNLVAFEAHNSSGMIGLNMIVGLLADGVHLVSSENISFMYNSINSTKSGGTSLMLDMGRNNIYRNIFANQEADGYVVAAYNQNPTSLFMDENDLFTRNLNQFGMFNGEAVVNFEDWQAKSGKDLGSSSVDPMYSQDDILFLTRYNPGLLHTEPMAMDMTPEHRDMFENYDWHGESRLEQGAYYFGIDNIKPEVIIDANPEELIVCHDDSNVEMYVGARITLGAQAIYEWYKDGVPVPNSNTPYLRFSELDYETSGVYHCRISGTGGAEPVNSKSAALYVLTEPEITQEPAALTEAAPGDVVKYHIQAHYRGVNEEDAILPLFQHKIQWYRWRSSVQGGPQALVDDDVISGSKSAILTFNGIRESDFTNGEEDYYYAIVTGQCGEAQTMNAKIVSKPVMSISSQPESIEACENTEATFTVGTDEVGNPTNIQYQWYFDGTPIQDDEYYSGATAAELNVFQLNPTLEGNYSCMITAEPDIQLMTDEAFLSVGLSPFLTEPIDFDVAVDEGTQVELYVPVDGAEPMFFVWEKEGTGVVLEGEGESTFVIEEMTSEDEGFYSCQISNECGEIQLSDNFNVFIKEGGISSVVFDKASGVKVNTPVPNPVNGIAEISYEMPKSAVTVIDLIDELGSKVGEIYNGTSVKGLNTVTYDFSNVPSGVYYFTIRSQGVFVTNKIMVVK